MTQLFQQVPDNQQYRAAANSYCLQVKTMHAEEQTVFQQGKTRAEHGDCRAAKADYQQMSSLPIENSTYRDQLLSLVRDCETRAAPQQTAAQQQERSHEQRPATGGSEEMLRNGIRAYFKGDLKTAEDDLTKYLHNPGDKSSLAYFFRGATRCSLFYLSGETDLSIKKSAIDDFQIVHQRYSTFKPPTQFFSPRILAIYQAP